jgi:hypothetical protein
MTRYATPREDWPTRAELAAEEAADAAGRLVTDGMARCRYGCTAWFHGHDTTAALRHYARHEGAA